MIYVFYEIKKGLFSVSKSGCDICFGLLLFLLRFTPAIETPFFGSNFAVFAVFVYFWPKMSG